MLCSVVLMFVYVAIVSLCQCCCVVGLLSLLVKYVTVLSVIYVNVLLRWCDFVVLFHALLLCVCCCCFVVVVVVVVVVLLSCC